MAYANSNAEPFSLSPVPSLILLGDSLTQYAWSNNGGWASILADRLQRRCDLISRGMSGYNTRQYRYYLPSIVEQFSSANISGFIIFLGANDAADQSLNPQQHIPLLEYENNLVAIVSFLLKRFPILTPDRVLIVSPPPVDEEMRQQHCNIQRTMLDRFNHVTQCYAKACLNAAQRTGATLVDFFGEAVKAGAARSMNESPEDRQPPSYRSFFVDGLHLGVDGASLLASVLWPYVNNITSDAKQFLPYWRDINPKLPPFNDY